MLNTIHNAWNRVRITDAEQCGDKTEDSETHKDMALP